MYNKEVKEQFINDKNLDFTIDTKNYLIHIFNKSEDIEEVYESDVSKFNLKQIKVLLKTYNSRSKNTLRTICYNLEKYYNWCINNKYIDDTNIQSLFDFKMVSPIIDEIIPDKMIDKKFFTKKTLLNDLEKIYDKSTKFIIYAIFSGVFGENGQDLSKLRMDDIDINNNTVILDSGKLLKVDDLFIQLAKDTNEDICYTEDEKSLKNFKGNNVYNSSPYIIKICKSKSDSLIISYKTLVGRIKSAQIKTENKFLNPANIYFNGLVNYVIKRMDENGLSFENLFLDSARNGSNKGEFTEIVESFIGEFGSTMKLSAFRFKLKDYYEFYLN